MLKPDYPEIDFDYDDFQFESIDEELQVDERCQRILKCFYLYLQQEGMNAERASEYAYSADLYVRDYLLDFARQNIVAPQPGLIRIFAASWFITHTLDPDMLMLERHLAAIVEFYNFLHRQHFISMAELAFLAEEAEETEYYQKRVSSFLNITGDGFAVWDAECPPFFK
ncbi:MAG TPA: hypothetical protein HPP76_01935 [Desulfuromonadales bacterium]|nr:hypothetical protein [Desulfuromonadales bacterium]